MSPKSALLDQLAPFLQPGEEVRNVVVVQVKRSATKNAAKSVAATTAATVATLALTGGMLGVSVAFTAPAVWCVSTSERLLLVSRESGKTPIVDRVLLSAPRGLVRAELKRLLLSQVSLVDVTDDSVIARLNVGAKHGAARAIVRELAPAA
ncbi:hypothetical protein [uncultured Cellulomonas sp.]|uniref:hypothetical protein n=1 Tax=uncultured Cellulomonas sp. TaxID=189682 RepID=UPI0028E69C0D|nr:hypothetical protein [uncultured Cellulomonas sp.]